MKQIEYKKRNGAWIAEYNGLFLATAKKKADCTAEAIDYLLDAANYAFHVPRMAVAKDGSIFCGRQQTDGQYTIYRDNGGCTGSTGQLTHEIFSNHVSDYDYCTTGIKD